MTKNWLIFPAIVGALLIGVLIGTKSCKGDGNTHKTNTATKTDTVYANKFIVSPPDTIIQHDKEVIYVTKLIPGDTKTIIKEVPRIEYKIQEKLTERLVKDTTCQDSLISFTLAMSELKDSLIKLQEYKTFNGEVKNKLYNIKYGVFARDVSDVEMIVKVKNRLEVTPMIGLSYQTNGKALKDFTYKPFLGGTINYNHFSLFGGMLWDTKTNNLNNYIIGSGYKLTL